MTPSESDRRVSPMEVLLADPAAGRAVVRECPAEEAAEEQAAVSAAPTKLLVVESRKRLPVLSNRAVLVAPMWWARKEEPTVSKS